MRRYEEIDKIFNYFRGVNYKVAGSVALFSFGYTPKIDDTLVFIVPDMFKAVNALLSDYTVFDSGDNYRKLYFHGHKQVVIIVEDYRYENLQTITRPLPVASCREVEILNRRELLNYYVSKVCHKSCMPIDTEYLKIITDYGRE